MSHQDYFPPAVPNYRQDSQPRRFPDDTSSNRQSSYHSALTPSNAHTPSANSNYSHAMTQSYRSENPHEYNDQEFATPYDPPHTLPSTNSFDTAGQLEADPYAGQYPPPRPRRTSTQPMTNPTYPPYSNNEYAPPAAGAFPVPQPYQNPSHQADDQATVHTSNSAYTRSSGHSNANSQSYSRRENSYDGLMGGNTAAAAAVGAVSGAALMAATNEHEPKEKGYYDPHAIPLDEWKQSEREASFANQGQATAGGNMIEMADSSNRRPSNQHNAMPQQPQPEPQYLEAGYPSVAPPSYLRPDRDGYLPGSRGRPQPKLQPRPVAQSSLPVATPTPNQYYRAPPPPMPQPYVMPPPPPPPQAYKPPRQQSSGCCCYCPALTCCSCFCMLISLGFVAAGIAMIVYAKVAVQSCPACDSSNFTSICNACNTVLYDGLFYGGIAVAALAGIGVVWRLFMWICSARR